MSELDTRNCTDCNGTMGEIIVIDRGHMNLQAGQIEYSAIDAKRSIWTGRPVAGTVKSFMCSECGLIKNYGVPKG